MNTKVVVCFCASMFFLFQDSDRICNAIQVDEGSANLIVEKYKDSLSKLKSGKCSVKFGTNTKKVFRDANESLVTFDEDSFRIDWIYPKNVAIENFFGGTTDYEIPEKIDTITGYFIRTPDGITQWLQGQYSIDIIRPEGQKMAYINFIDPRAMGLYSWVGFHQGRDSTEAVKGLEKLPIYSLIEIADQIYEISWRPNETFEWSITFDGNQGYVPVSNTLKSRSTVEKPWVVIEESKTEWKKVSGAWVPTSIVLNLKEPAYEPDERKLILTWESVNADVPEEEFTFWSFDAPNNVCVADHRLGPRIEIKAGGVPFKK